MTSCLIAMAMGCEQTDEERACGGDQSWSTGTEPATELSLTVDCDVTAGTIEQLTADNCAEVMLSFTTTEPQTYTFDVADPLNLFYVTYNSDRFSVGPLRFEFSFYMDDAGMHLAQGHQPSLNVNMPMEQFDAGNSTIGDFNDPDGCTRDGTCTELQLRATLDEEDYTDGSNNIGQYNLGVGVSGEVEITRTALTDGERLQLVIDKVPLAIANIEQDYLCDDGLIHYRSD